MVLKVLELLTSSKVSWEDAVQQTVKQVAKSYSIHSIYIKEQSEKVVDSNIVEYRVNAQVTFALSDSDDE